MGRGRLAACSIPIETLGKERNCSQVCKLYCGASLHFFLYPFFTLSFLVDFSTLVKIYATFYYYDFLAVKV